MAVEHEDDQRSHEGAAAAESAGDATILDLLHLRALDHRGDLSPDSRSLHMLRTHDGREKVLRDFVIAMMPDRINPALWLQWLRGAAAPFEGAKLSRVETGQEGTTKALARSSKRVVKKSDNVFKARRALEEAKAKLATAERELVEERAFDAAVIEYAVSEHLLSIMAPMFAMGPAWTVMRALSSYVPPAEMAEELKYFRDHSEKRAQREAEIRSEWLEVTDKVMDALDLWAGDVEFEHDLRKAVVKVVGSYEGRDRPDAERRSRKSMRERVRDGELIRDRDATIAGVGRSSGD